MPAKITNKDKYRYIPLYPARDAIIPPITEPNPMPPSKPVKKVAFAAPRLSLGARTIAIA